MHENILKDLEGLCKSDSIVIIGLGNPDRADDGIGIALAEKLRERFPGRSFSEQDRSVESIVIDCIENNRVGVILFIDATDFGGEPGEIRLFTLKETERFVPSFSTHKVPITLLMGLVNQKNKKSFLLGIQPQSIGFLGKMSPIIETRLHELDKILSKLMCG